MNLSLSAYYLGGTAPHLPNDVAALATFRSSGNLAPVTARAPGSSNAEGSSGGVPPQLNHLSFRLIDISGRPLPDYSLGPAAD